MVRCTAVISAPCFTYHCISGAYSSSVCADGAPTSFFPSPLLLAGTIHVILHVLGHRLIGDLFSEEKQWHFFELYPQFLWDLDVHIREAKPRSNFQATDERGRVDTIFQCKSLASFPEPPGLALRQGLEKNTPSA